MLSRYIEARLVVMFHDHEHYHFFAEDLDKRDVDTIVDLANEFRFDEQQRMLSLEIWMDRKSRMLRERERAQWFVDMYEEYRGSSLYGEMGEDEHTVIHDLIMAEISDPDRQGVWTELGSSLPDTLFDMREIKNRKKISSVDTLVLSGMGVHELYDEYPEWFDSWEQNGFDGLLEAVAFAGAVVQERVLNGEQIFSNKKATFEIESQDTQRKSIIALSGSFHGDFILYSQDIPSDETYDNRGHRRPFAPAGEVTAISAYHSVEMSLLKSIFIHMDNVMTVQEQRKTMKDAQSLIRESLALPRSTGPFGGANFADYADEDVEMEVDRLKHWHSTGFSSLSGRGNNYISNIVVPGNDSIIFEVCAGETGSLRLQNTAKIDEGEYEIERWVDIPVEYMPNMMNALIAQAAAGDGRTGPEVLIRFVEEHANHLEKIFER